MTVTNRRITRPRLERTMFESSRAAEYFDARKLSTLTGMPPDEFASVCLKELVDNALDACETAGVAPEVTVEVERVLEDLLSTDRIKRIVRRAFRERHNLPDARQWIEEAFKQDRSLSWRMALEKELGQRSEGFHAEVREAVEKAAWKMLSE